MWWIAGLVACGLGVDNDLWLDVHHEDDGKVELHLPANWIVDQEGSLDFDTPDGRVDLKEEAAELRRMPGRGSRTWQLDSDVTVTLSEASPGGEPRADRLRIGTKGKKGFGLGITVPLDADGSQRCAKALGEHIEVEEIDVEFGPAFCAQLASSAPTTVLKVTGGLLGGVTIETVAGQSD